MVKVIAVDIGGTNLRVSLVENQKIKHYIKKNTPKDAKKLLFELDNSISQIISKDIRGIGVGSPGPLKNGIIKNPPNIPLKNFNLKRYLEKKFKKKVVVENDVHCIAIAEAKLGCKKKNFIVLAFGTGVGGGIIIDGKLFTGGNSKSSGGYGGELGHIVIENGKFLEDLWKESKKKIEENFGKNILIKDLIKMKDQKAEEILNEITDFIAKALGSLANIFDPEVIVLSGGFKETGDVLLKEIEKKAQRYVILPKKISIQWSKLDHPGTLGASLLVSS